MYPLQFVKSIKDKEIVKDFNADINYTMNHDDSSPCKSQLPIVLNGIESEKILRLKRKSRQANLKKKSGISKKLLVRKRKENDKETLRSSRINTYGCNHNFNANLGLVRIIKTSDKIDNFIDQPEASTDIPDININHIFQNIQDNSGQTQEMEFKKNCFKKDYIEMYKNANRHTSALSEGNTNPYDKDSAKENKKKYIEDYQLNDDCEEKNVGSAISQNKIKKTIPLSSKENHLVGVSAGTAAAV
ncbi:uncharacterized protein LOC111081630 [Drosophila obscura]|uniref:uncharacterized protein LOC111081630 n=1 Tax=Drosophila obscura TaxID=7282 RepID=UPI001BB16B13|nr:uncharacterized protein LOC111081630 [Drosophila obscura]